MTREFAPCYDAYHAISTRQHELRREAAQVRLARDLPADPVAPERPRFRRARLWLIALGLAALLLGSSALFARAGSLRAAGQVYTIATIQVELAKDPASWEGRTVRVRAVLWGCRVWRGALRTSACLVWQPVLLDATRADATRPLPLAWGETPPVLTLLRSLPAIGHLVPAPQVPMWGVAAIYRVQIQVRRCSTSQPPPCWQIMLLDAGSRAGPRPLHGGPRSPTAPRAF